MSAAILSLGTVVPPYSIDQTALAESVSRKLSLDSKWKQKIIKINQATKIKTRHSVIPDFCSEDLRGDLYSDTYPIDVPGSLERNEIYKREAPKLALQACHKALNDWGGDPQEITHIISISCTGMIAPGIEFHLVDALNLSRSTKRLGINFMGCFAAFQGLSTAKAYALENPKHRILMVCTELCSLHMQDDISMETFISNALFADGAAAVVIGCAPAPKENVLWTIEKQQSLAMEGSLDEMTWKIGDHGFMMKLTSEVPRQVKKHLQLFSDMILGDTIDKKNCDWLVHPGGKAILEAVADEFSLCHNKDLKPSWDVLKSHGNMSSPTFLFVLDAKRKMASQKPWAVGLAFGPGLTLEGVLLKYEA